MSDLIDRQAVIEALRETFKRNPTTAIRAMETIRALPSAQPEIIRCKDCRWGREACGNIECFADLNEPPEYHGYEWFCPNGERRTDDKR